MMGVLKVSLLFLLVITGVLLGPLLSGYQGYVLIQTNQYSIETSIIGLVIIFICIINVLLMAKWILQHSFFININTHSWFSNHKYKCALQQTEQAILKLAEGDYRQVEKLVLENPNCTEQSLVNYLLAAIAAQQHGDETRANQHLEQAIKLMSNDSILVEITRIRLQLARNENHAARHSVNRLLEMTQCHPEVLRLAERAYIKTSSWRSLLNIIPLMIKTGVGNDDHRKALQQQAWIGLINQVRINLGSNGLKIWWKNQNFKTRHQTILQVIMAEHLIDCGDHNSAQEIIFDGLEHQYDDRLVMVIARLKTSNYEQTEKMLRQQIKIVGDRPLLWSTLGQSLMKHGEWQEAGLAFRIALKKRPDPFDYACLANALDKQNKPKEAADMRRDSLMLTLQNNHRSS